MSVFIPQQPMSRPMRTAEDFAWEALYCSAHDSATAAEVVEFLAADVEVRRTHLALYLLCRQSVREAEARRIRTQRIAAVLRRLVDLVIAAPLAAIGRLLRGGTDVAIAMMPKADSATSSSRRKAAAPRRTRQPAKTAESGHTVHAFPSVSTGPRSTGNGPDVPR